MALLNANSLLAGQSLCPFILGKSDQRLLPVIVGNPPWSNFGRRNRGPWIDNLLADYRADLGERKSNLADDAIKFIRWSHYWIEQSGGGIVALVTPNTWLDGLTHRRMRESLLRSFDEMIVLDLHGEAGGESGDENVFDIRTGVAAVVMVKRPGRISGGPHHARRYDLTGQRSSKLIALAQFNLETTPRDPLRPTAPDWRLSSRPRRSHRRTRPIDYASFWPLDRIFHHYISGVQTKNDDVLVAFTADDLSYQVRLWLARQPDPIEFNAKLILPYLVAPFDRRVVYYDPRLVGRARYSVMRYMLRPNVGLVFMRQSTNPGEYDHFLAVDCLVSDRVFYSRHGAPFLAPLWLDSGGQRSEVRGQKGDSAHHSVPEANFTPDFVAAFSSALGDYQFNPRQAFEYLYAVGYSPAFRRHYREELCRGFPRLPLPPITGTYRALHQLGKQLIELHVGQRPLPPSVRQAEENDSVFRLGGYDVLRRWKSPRAKRGLTPVDEVVLDRLASIGRETRRLMEEIDTVASDYLLGSPQPPPPGVSMLSTSPA